MLDKWYVNVYKWQTLREAIFMGKIYWNLKEIPQPNESHINKSDGRVFIFLRDNDKVRESSRKVIGHATSDTTMHPNDNFRYLYPNLWKGYYGDSGVLERVIRCGMYAMTLGIGYKTALYQTLIEVYGPMYANVIMDYAMYSVLEKSDISQTYEERTQQEAIFSKERYSDSWFSDFLKNKINEQQHLDFRDRWIIECKKRKLSGVWISIDGSNNNCEAKSCHLTEKGSAKSGKNIDIISYMYAINTEDGGPITYFVNNGGKVDAKAFQKMAIYLGSHDINIEGVILDRGFCTHDVMELLAELKYPYVIMLKSDTYGHTQMVGQYAETIRWKVPYAIDGDGMFGISEKKKVFKEHPEEAYINLFFDGSNAAQRSITLIRKIMKATEELRTKINAGDIPRVPQDLKKYIAVKEEFAGYRIIHNHEEWQMAIDGKGFLSIATTENMGPMEANRLYHLRDASETQYMIMKSQLGYDVTRVHSTESIHSKFAICFVAGIIRCEIINACKEINQDTNKMIMEIDRLEFFLLQNNIYTAIHDETKRQKDLLEKFDIKPPDFDSIVQDLNQRLTSKISSQVHKKPEHSQTGVYKRGRPIGSKSKRKKSGVSALTDETLKRKPGRPKGSLNKKTIETELQEADGNERRKPGRPIGSKNKLKVLPATQEKRGRGRPKGSKNKVK